MNLIDCLQNFMLQLHFLRANFSEILLSIKKLPFFILEKKNVAFDAQMKNNINLASKSRVIFETVNLNEGNGYDPSTGIFTAPAAGMYVFDWTTLTQYGKDVLTSLVVNNNFKSWNYCRNGSSNTHLSCSKMTVVKLKQGDQVWIVVFTETANINYKYTSFSGYKL